eukprot:gene9802-1995_t
MSDRISQLQDLLQQLMEHYRNAVGAIHSQACDTLVATQAHLPSSQESDAAVYDRLMHVVGGFRTNISRIMEDIDIFCDHLPDLHLSSMVVKNDFEKLNELNSAAAQKLRDHLRIAEDKLVEIRTSIKTITDNAFLTSVNKEKIHSNDRNLSSSSEQAVQSDSYELNSQIISLQNTDSALLKDSETVSSLENSSSGTPNVESATTNIEPVKIEANCKNWDLDPKRKTECDDDRPLEKRAKFTE